MELIFGLIPPNRRGKHPQFTQIDSYILNSLSIKPMNAYQLFSETKLTKRYSSVHYSLNKMERNFLISRYETEPIPPPKKAKIKPYMLTVIGMSVLVMSADTFEQALEKQGKIVSSYINLKIPDHVRLPLLKVNSSREMGAYFHRILNLKLNFTFCRVFNLIRVIPYSPKYLRKIEVDCQANRSRDLKFIIASPLTVRSTLRVYYQELINGGFWELFCRPEGPFDLSSWVKVCTKDPDMMDYLRLYLSKKIKALKSELSRYSYYLKKLK